MGAEFKSRINRRNKYIILSNPPSANNIKTIMKLFNLSKRLEIRSRYDLFKMLFPRIQRISLQKFLILITRVLKETSSLNVRG